MDQRKKFIKKENSWRKVDTKEYEKCARKMNKINYEGIKIL